MSTVLGTVAGGLSKLTALNREGTIYWWALGDGRSVEEGTIAAVSGATTQIQVPVKDRPVALFPLLRPMPGSAADVWRCCITRTSDPGVYGLGVFGDDHHFRTVASFSVPDATGIELTAGQFGMMIIVTRSFHSRRLLNLIPVDWNQGETSSALSTLFLPDLPASAIGRVHGICTLDSAKDLHFKLVVACQDDRSLSWAELDVGLYSDSRGWQLRSNEASWRVHQEDDFKVLDPTLHWGPDGALELLARSALPGAHDAALRRLSGATGWAPSDVLYAQGSQSLNQVLPAVAYVPGDPTPAKSNSGAEGVEVDIQRWTLFPIGRGDLGAVLTEIVLEKKVVGKARRWAKGLMQAEKKLLVGLIEGPPPVPAENLNLAPQMDKSSAAAETLLSDQASNTSSFEFSFSAAAIFKMKGEFGFIFSGTSSFSLSVAATAGSKQTVTTTLTQSFKNTLKQEQREGRAVVQPLGTAIVAGITFSGFEFEYLDAKGHVVTDAPVMRQVLPHAVAVEALPYVLHPQYTPRPGELDSYVADGARQKLLQHTLPFVDGTDRLIGSWALAGTSQQSGQRVELNQLSRGFSIDVKLMLGIKASFLGEKGEVGGGFQIKVSGNWTSASQTTRSLSTSVALPGNRSAVGSYYAYAYETYLLQPGASYEAQFLDRLVTEGWPREPHDRQLNQDLRNALAPTADGAAGPWLITYALAEAHKVEPVAAWLARHGAHFDAEIRQWIEQSGASTTAELAQAVSTGPMAWREGMLRRLGEPSAVAGQLAD